jgi:2-polyprenyl-3-methyl-5-hydroxy-6-metoxy-1,4-benzoquinol methylase
MNDLRGEAAAFNSQIRERVAHGHVPDLRRVRDCDWFYANPWRRKAYATLDFGYLFERVNAAILAHAPSSGERLRVLEVGSGPGWLSLELARAGHDVTGIDLAGDAVAVAREFADSDPWKAERGPLRYLVDDFLATRALAAVSFDAVVFVGALHHFPNQGAVGRRVVDLLRPGGIVVAHEPTRDRVTEGLAEFGLLVRVLLAAGGGWFDELSVPGSAAEKERLIAKLKRDIEFVDEGGDKVQSPNDNEAGYAAMHAMLSTGFDTILEEDTFAFFHEVIGGLRFDEATNAKLARYLRDADASLVKSGILPAYEFLFVGRRRG